MTGGTVDSLAEHTTALFQLLRFSSPSLPIGGFAWSQGLEAAIERSWLRNEEDLHAWLRAGLEQNFARQELPLLLRMLNAEGQDEIADWNGRSLAMRETAELRLEDVQTGRALMRLSLSLGMDVAGTWSPQEDIGYLAAFALVCRHHGIAFAPAATGFIWSWLDNQVAAAIKLMPLGQTAGQLLIEQLAPAIPDIIARASQVDDEDIGISLPGQVMASMLHEIQYSRMFRS
tara:strand:+ start:13239 stop:13931 length:693 start_codon:yes stop_codon:yes gene_type:complete